MPPRGLQIYFLLRVTSNFDFLPPRVDISCFTQATTCTKSHQDRFIPFQRQFGNKRRTDGRTDGQVDNVIPLPASLLAKASNYCNQFFLSLCLVWLILDIILVVVCG